MECFNALARVPAIRQRCSSGCTTRAPALARRTRVVYIATMTSTADPSALYPRPAGIPAPVQWIGDRDGFLRLLDQTRLPHFVDFIDCSSVEMVWDCIKRLCVRGAPAIGVAAAYGLCLAVRSDSGLPAARFLNAVAAAGNFLCSARPTAVNLAWAVRRITNAVEIAVKSNDSDLWSAAFRQAAAIELDDIQTCRAIGQAGEKLITDGVGVLTHCNAGALATAGYGTALAPMFFAHQNGRKFRVFADETRPLLQGARLTTFELLAAGIDVTLICDNMAASLMNAGFVQLVIVGADRIAANGDAANKIGTLALAILARRFSIPFYVAAPRSTFDLEIPDGKHIPIEVRDENEIALVASHRVAPPGVVCFNPAFDVTPAELITGIITECGVTKPVTKHAIKCLF